jgi:GWxTD domain-containing protein
MKRSMMLAAALAVVVPPADAGVAPQGERNLAVATRRFYRADVGTSLQGLCRVPFELLEPVRQGPDGFGAYRLSLVVRDSAGATLTEQSWSQRVPASVLNVQGASAVEQFRFALPRGRFAVDVAVTDSASGRVVRSTVEVEAFGQAPPASDLLLSANIRQAPDSAVPGAGELLVGGFLIAAQPEPVLTPSQSRLFYYVELYPSGPVEARVTARVRDGRGRELTATRAESVSLAGAGVATSGLDLAGLPEGEYRLELDIAMPDTTVVRTAAFRMAGFQTEAAIARAVQAQAADVFARFTEDQLDSLYRPLVYIQERGERGVYEGLSAEGKRNYLRQFWGRRDPTPGTPVNEAMREYYGLMNAANLQFREGGAGDVPGWRTDRGRIYIKYGAPDEVLRRPQSVTQPYEAWKYTQGRPRKFVFVDETGLGHFVLVFTDERREPSRLDWERLLGAEAVAEIIRF